MSRLYHPFGDGNGRTARLIEFGILSTSEIAETSPKLAKLYAGTSARTLQRDLQELREMGLLTDTNGSWRSNVSVIEAFLPARRALPSAQRPVGPSQAAPSKRRAE